jgi:hypothetical protein
MRKIIGAVSVIVLVGLAGAIAATQSGMAASAKRPAVTPTTMPSSTRPAEGRENAGATNAMRRAADAKKHLFVFIYEKDNEQMRAGRKTFDSAVRRLVDAVQWTTVNRTARSEQEFVAKYGLKSAPMPAVLVFTPNGAIAGGFVGARLTETQLVDSLVSPAKQACLKGLQDRRLVFLCVRSGTEKNDEVAIKGVNEFKADTRFSSTTEIVRVNRSDSAELKFLAQLEIDPKVDQATTVFLAPPGALIGKYVGATDKAKLVAALEAASSGGCSGKVGCCPAKK